MALKYMNSMALNYMNIVISSAINFRSRYEEKYLQGIVLKIDL